MVDFKLGPVKRYAKLANNKASQQFISERCPSKFGFMEMAVSQFG